MKLIAKPSKENIKTYVPIGLSLVFLSFFDVFTNAFFNYNLMTFLPSQLSYFLPLLLGLCMDFIQMLSNGELILHF